MSELILGPIIGGLAQDHAHLWGRCDGPGVLHAWLGRQPDLSDAYLSSTSLPLDAHDGYAGVAVVKGLKPETCYYYALTLNDAPPKQTREECPAFTTAPLPGRRVSFNFAFGSCFLPKDAQGGQIFGMIDERRRYDNLRFILLIGDQIYADDSLHNGIGKVACSLEEYRAVYAYTWSRPKFQQMLENLPAYMTLDDHEVDDDWRWTDSSRRLATIPWWNQFKRWRQGCGPDERLLPVQRVQNALQTYWEHQGMHAPGMELPPQLDQAGQYTLDIDDPGSLAYTFTYGAAAFFVLDTRSMRVCRGGERTMMNDGQWQALKSWLMAVKSLYPVKFLVTSCSLLHPMWHDIPRDRWSGFPEERDRLLHFLAANGIEGVYLLAGDLHSSHAVYAELYGPQRQALPLWEFCSTPFEQNPNRLARYTYTPVRSGPIKSTRRVFCVSQCNFGIVRVDFSKGKRPRVAFQVYGEGGEMLEEVEG